MYNGLTSGDGFIYIQIHWKHVYDIGGSGIGCVGVRVFLATRAPRKEFFTKEQTHLWAPCSCSRWITSADDNRGLTEAEPFLVTTGDLGLVVVMLVDAVGDMVYYR